MFFLHVLHLDEHPVFCGTMFIPCIAFEITIDDELKDGIGGRNILCK
jgi:hypothetical protein